MVNQEAGAAAADSGRRDQILDAALHVMAEHGFRGASIKRIAERAGLKSPALIYWYFADKHALFEAMLRRMAPFLSVVSEAEAALDDPPDEVLPRLVTSFLDASQQPATGRFVRVVLSEAVRHPTVAAVFAERGPLVILGFLERYLSRQTELGRLRPHDPRASARAFMGMLIVHVLGREIFPAVGSGFPPRDSYGREVTSLFLNGLSATVPRASRRSTAA
jgi:TetR/AcrR family transcriptional regulator